MSGLRMPPIGVEDFEEIRRKNCYYVDGLSISCGEGLCAEHLGKYPVISITLKGVNGSSFEKARAALGTIMVDEATREEMEELLRGGIRGVCDSVAGEK